MSKYTNGNESIAPYLEAANRGRPGRVERHIHTLACLNFKDKKPDDPLEFICGLEETSEPRAQFKGDVHHG